MASPTDEPRPTAEPKKITFRFCRECSNLLYPKEDKLSNTLMFACRTCPFSEAATSSCVFRNELSNTVGETAGITQDVGSDPTVGDSPEDFLCLHCGATRCCELCDLVRKARVLGLTVGVNGDDGSEMDLAMDTEEGNLGIDAGVDSEMVTEGSMEVNAKEQAKEQTRNELNMAVTRAKRAKPSKWVNYDSDDEHSGSLTAAAGPTKDK